jgi:6-pyruvoyltetrahydropterin/6-carboxytetrahydropterin synthase
MREVQFDAGHRLLNHESKCAHLHGHRYRVELHARAPQIDTLGRVIDFSVLKQRIGGWIDEKWDHGFLLNEHDAEAVAAVASVKPAKYYLLPNNPTAENIAQYLIKVCREQLAGLAVEVFKVVVWETPNCHATAWEDTW